MPNPDGGELVGLSHAILSARDLAANAARARCPVLIAGETGVGKRHLARYIHHCSERRGEPCTIINCTAFVGADLEEEIAWALRASASRGARGPSAGETTGVLILDEIEGIAMGTQAKLVETLDSGVLDVSRSNKWNRLDTQFIATTKVDLPRKVRSGEFREDLFLRMAVLRLTLPPLRRRREDIPLLVEHFTALHCRRAKKQHTGFAPGSTEMLQGYGWPGNVRELENVVHRGVVLSEDGVVSFGDLGLPCDGAGRLDGGQAGEKDLRRLVEGDVGLDDYLASIEKRCVVNALEACGWNQTRAAEMLGIPFRSIRYRIKKLGVERSDLNTTHPDGECTDEAF
jgi:DNA-binding NtrC family response regulator